MKAVIQRVSSAAVGVEGVERGAISGGLLVLVGLEGSDTDADLAWMAGKIAELRIFADDEGKMNRSVKDVGGSVLLVPNFTVAGDARKGRRPSFDGAMRPELAEPVFSRLASMVAGRGVAVQTGVFRAHMMVSLVNDGPITILLDSAEVRR